MIMMLEMIIPIVGVLTSIAFFTLMERKIMGLMHFRMGPNKVLASGVLQPMADAAKLLHKETPKLPFNKSMMYFSGPLVGLMLMFLCWLWYNFTSQMISNEMKLMTVLATMSLVAYSFMFMSWGSNSKYAMLGGHRAVSQIVSYEVCFFIFLMVVCYSTSSYSMKLMEMLQQGMWMSLFTAPLFMMWITMAMAECNRTPFDMAEGESEIVSGFNVEYSGGLFAVIFISEYGSILFMSFLTMVMFTSSSLMLMKIFMMSFMFIWTRCSFPRVRYDQLMNMSWKMALPFSILMCSLTMLII